MKRHQDWRRRVSSQFEGTVTEIIKSLKMDGYSLTAAASILEISPHTLKSECDRTGIEFKRYQQSPGRKKHVFVKHPPTMRMLEHDGVVLHLSGWARKLNIEHTTLAYRLDVMKLSVKDALTRPVCKHNHRPSAP